MIFEDVAHSMVYPQTLHTFISAFSISILQCLYHFLIMRIEHYTLPFIYLFVFIGVFGFLTINSNGSLFSTQKVTYKDASVRFSPFENPSVNTAAAVGSVSNEFLAYWPFDEKEGVTLRDRSAWGNIGVLKGSPMWVEGKVGSALYFDGVDDHVLIDNSGSLNVASAFSISVWVRPEDNNLGTIVSKNGLKETVRGGYKLSVGDSTLIYSVEGMASLASKTIFLKPKEWTYILVTYDAKRSSRTHLYVNGNRILSGTILAPEQNVSELLIGRSQSGEFFKGSIDELRIYNRSLTDAEIGILYHVYMNQTENVATTKSSAPQNTTLATFFASTFKGWVTLLGE